MVCHSQGSVSIESKKSEQKPLLTELEDASAPHVQVNNTANIRKKFLLWNTPVSDDVVTVALG